MFLSWLHKIWKFLLSTIVIITLTLIVAGILLFAVLQLPQSKDYINGQLVQLFNENYEGRIEVEQLGGTLPFSTSLYNVKIYSPDDMDDPVVSVQKTRLKVGLWDLLQRNISIHALELNRPAILLKRNREDILTIENAFRLKKRPENRSSSKTNFGHIEIYAPSILVREGELTAENVYDDYRNIGVPPSFAFKNIEADLNVELTPQQRFLDIEYFSADWPEKEVNAFNANGQIFSDDQYLEFNGFNIQTAKSQLEFSGEASPVDLTSADLAVQLANAGYRLDIKDTYLHGETLAYFIPDYPFMDVGLDIELLAEGTFELFHVDKFIGRIGESTVNLTGQFRNIDNPGVEYEIAVNNVLFQQDELQLFSDTYLKFGEEELDYLSSSSLSGQIAGNRHQLDTDLTYTTRKGQLQLDASLLFETPMTYQANLQLDSLDLSPIAPRYFERNLLNGNIGFTGSGITLDDLQAEVTASIDSGYVNHIDFTQGRFEGLIDKRSIEHEFILENGNSAFRSSGLIRNAAGEWIISLEGNTQNLDIRRAMNREDLPTTSLNIEYGGELQWTSLDDLYGRVSFQVDDSVIGLDTLRAHQFYADIDAPSQTGEAERTLRLTSSFLDAEISGDIYPKNLRRLFYHWEGYVRNQVAEEIVMDTTLAAFPTLLPDTDDITPADLHLSLEIKDVVLLQKYFTEEPRLESQSRINMNINADADRVLVTGSLEDSGFRYGDFNSSSLSADITTSFRFEEKFRNYGTLDFQVNSSNYQFKNYNFSEGHFNASMRNDSLTVQHSAMNDDDISLNLSLLTRLKPDSLNIEVRDFYLGNDRYEWITEGTPKLTYLSDKSLKVENVNFTSDNERIEVSGIFSSDPNDSVEYTVRNLNLQRISELITGRIDFAGVVNGDVMTQTLTHIPIFEGNLQVRELMLNDRLVGDVSLNSTYSTDNDRFNTSISVITDPHRYPDYIEDNEDIGQNLLLEGYVSVPDPDNPDEDFFHFDADLQEIDMWIVTVIVPNIVEEMEGRASGTGYLRGSLTDHDFSAEFDINDVTGVPAFMNTRYIIDGRLVFNRHDGLIFDNLNLRDDQGGTGLLYGTVDLDDFSGTTYLDLTMELNNLQFMNNPYDPDIPFYASARGTGQARITGSNFSPFLRTTQPIVISPDSRISVPVVDDTELQQSQNFIRFVDTFDWQTLRERELNGDQNTEGTTFQFDPDALTFVERFTLDLQFLAEDPVNFRLIFDRVTNEILTASGTGQIRLNLTDQNFSIFGRMNITGGDYQFVAGDIISRRFQLMQGGSILWEGDPANARLNVNASYRARPDLSALMTSGSINSQQGGQRFPVDLILNIGGTLTELENDFYFQVPSNIEGTLDPTLLTQINSINRNEEEKIIQATSILISGNFIPLTTASTEGGTGMALRDALSSGAVVNPLITGQVINPLLSDQINSLLRSDMSLDIDFNLTTYNQIDLGVAFRLYNDRLILRRDGQITGPYSDIGDLGATYRINNVFAITAFHRQDPTLTNTSTNETRQVQEMNGVGVEAQIQFNTWQEFLNRISNAVQRLFGRKDNDSESDEDNGREAIASD